MFELPSPLELITHPMLMDHNVKLYIKRDDLIHEEVSGNKWRKLKYHLEEMKRLEFKKMVTFGGAYSNHIAATAAAAHMMGYQAIGVVRGDELHGEINPTLKRAGELGMEFRFVSRDQYRSWRSNSYAFVHKQCPDGYVIPEGGSSELGVKGVSQIIDEIDVPFDVIITAVGTGTTLTGLVRGLKGNSHVIGYSVLKGSFILNDVSEQMKINGIDYSNYSINTDFHFGGYGKTNEQLIDFINEMTDGLGIKLDPIYTGKAFFGVWDMIKRGKFDNQTLIFLHTGGLQGIAGHNQKNPQKIHN